MKRLQAVKTEMTPRMKAAVEALNRFMWTSDQMWLRQVAAEVLDAADRATEPVATAAVPSHPYPETN